MSPFDVIVIGAGPGGSASAYLLARAGMRVALIDKAAFPRDKLCGGMLSERTEKVYKSIFGDSWQDAYEFSSSDVDFFYKARLLNEVRNYRRMYFTMRSNFDHRLAALAAAKGAVLMENTRAVSLEQRTGSVRLASGTAINGDFIIGADGATGMVAQSLGMSRSKQHQAAGLEIEFPRQGARAGLDRPEFHFGVLRWGYGWVFPKKETLTIGIAGLVRKNPGLKNSFRIFLERICSRVPDIKWKAHPIPFCNLLLRPGRGNILLVGDAAGFVEPVTGEGIAFAMQSALHAAHAVLDAAGSGKPESALKNYQNRYDTLARHLTLANRMRFLVFSSLSEKLFAKAIAKSKSLIHRYMDLAAGEMDYAAYAKFLIKKMVRIG
jgi:geranylgeranyl reductase family protein